MKLPVAIEHELFRGETEVRLHAQQGYNCEADFALRLATQLAIAAASPDGEDSAGRQKLQLMPPGDVAWRACEISRLMHQEFETRGWLVDMPLPRPPKAKSEL